MILKRKIFVGEENKYVNEN